MTEIRWIYGLVDPRDGQVYYVGQTRTALHTRLMRHRASRKTLSWMRLSQWLTALIEQGVDPEIVLLEEVSAADADRIEREWIQRLHTDERPLVNSTYTGQLTPTTLENRLRREETLAAIVPYRTRIEPSDLPEAPAAMTPAEIRDFRQRAGLSQVQLGKMLGYQGSSISYWESGKRTPPPSLRRVFERLHEELQS